jgi:hypothetical protein
MRQHLSSTVVAALVILAAPVSAQTTLNRQDAVEVRTQLIADLDTLNNKLTALANAFPEDKYSWRPGPGVRSVGEVFMHVSYGFYTFMPQVFGGNASTDVPQGKGAYLKFEQMSTKADVLKHLAAGWAYAKGAIASADPSAFAGGKTFGGHQYSIVDLSFQMTGDVHEHLSQLIAYARTNGIKPPWSK